MALNLIALRLNSGAGSIVRKGSKVMAREYKTQMEAARKGIVTPEIEKVAAKERMTVEELKPYYDAQFEAAVVRSILTSKAMRLVRDCAEIEAV